LNAPIWIIGLFALFVSERFREFRFLAWTFVFCFVTFVVLKGKAYYVAPIYPMLLAAGAVTVEALLLKTAPHHWLRRAIPTAMIILLLAGGALLTPLIVPVLPINTFISYMERLPFKEPRSEHSHERALLPQHYADQFGWEELTAKTAEAWSRLTTQ